MDKKESKKSAGGLKKYSPLTLRYNEDLLPLVLTGNNRP
jgi:hypothetical protein